MTDAEFRQAVEQYGDMVFRLAVNECRHLLRAAIAVVMVMALAVTAGAVNLAIDGALFRQLKINWVGESSLRAEDAAGNQVHITLTDTDLVTKENSRLFLHANGTKIDSTDELKETGSYRYVHDVTVVYEDGSEESRQVTITVTGNLESWTVTQDNGDSACIATTGRKSGVR